MTKRFGHSTGTRGLAGYISAFWLRRSILEEEGLRSAVARDEELRQSRPDLWRSLEAARRAENRETAATNRRLRALGLEPLRLRLSLAQRRQELRRLEARNMAEIAALTSKQTKSAATARGTRLAIEES